MGDTNRWVVKGVLEGGLHIPKKDSIFPVERGTVALTRYAIMEQNLQRHFTRWPPEKMIHLGLEIPTEADDVCVAWQEMEAFVRALAIQKNVPITVRIIEMTDKPEEWPEGIEFLITRYFPVCSEEWTPAVHHGDPKNRVRFSAFSGSATTAGLGLTLEKRHKKFLVHDKYRSELVKDYIAGLDVESKELSLAMLYYFKVLERIGKQEYGNPAKGAMKDITLKAIIKELDTELTVEERQSLKAINRWRNKKSEAHLVTEGLPTRVELGLCKKLARLAILKRV